MLSTLIKTVIALLSEVNSKFTDLIKNSHSDIRPGSFVAMETVVLKKKIPTRLAYFGVKILTGIMQSLRYYHLKELCTQLKRKTFIAVTD